MNVGAFHESVKQQINDNNKAKIVSFELSSENYRV